MRALTYNLLAGEDDAAVRLSQATQLLQAAQPDVLGLNECTLLAERTRLREIEQALGMQARLVSAASGFHLALLVRGQLEQLSVLQEGFAHAAMLATLRVRGCQLQAVVTHLDPFSAERRLHEVEQILRVVDSTGPTLLLGDLNAISPRDVAHVDPAQWVERYRKRHVDARGQLDTRAIERLEQSGLVDVHAALHSPTLPTRPTARYARADRPSQRLDYMFASPQLAAAASACAPYQHALAELASDHYPLCADFALQ